MRGNHRAGADPLHTRAPVAAPWLADGADDETTLGLRGLCPNCVLCWLAGKCDYVYINHICLYPICVCACSMCIYVPYVYMPSLYVYVSQAQAID